MLRSGARSAGAVWPSSRGGMAGSSAGGACTRMRGVSVRGVYQLHASLQCCVNFVSV